MSLLPSEFQIHSSGSCRVADMEKFETLRELIHCTKDVYNVQLFNRAISILTNTSVDKSPTPFPTSQDFTAAPSLSPTTSPTVSTTRYSDCVDGDRSYCSNRGHCVAETGRCECDDHLHYWPSENCKTWHDGRELAEGWFCYPDTVDQYCSWMGVCSSDGLMCECFDSEHRISADRCYNWHLDDGSEATLAPTPQSDNVPDVCVSGDRGYCHNKGVCVSPERGCACDDPGRYWASEHCAVKHWGPELQSDECCSPHSVDIYCSWMGVCGSDGLTCSCFDHQHRSGHDRCQMWYDNVTRLGASSALSVGGSCPAVMEVPGEEDGSSKSSSGSSNKKSPLSTMQWMTVGATVGCLILVSLVAMVVVKLRRVGDEGDFQGEYALPGGGRLPRGSRFSFTSPMWGSKRAPPAAAPVSGRQTPLPTSTGLPQSKGQPKSKDLVKSLSLMSMHSKEYDELVDDDGAQI